MDQGGQEEAFEGIIEVVFFISSAPPALTHAIFRSRESRQNTLNSQYECGSRSGYANGCNDGGNSYGQFDQQNFNGNSRGNQNFLPPNHNTGYGFDNGQYHGGGWNQNDNWRGNQGGHDSDAFRGNFGEFNQGYFDGAQGYGQNFNANNLSGGPRPQHPYRNSGQGGRGRGGHGGRGRSNGRGAGGRVPPGVARTGTGTPEVQQPLLAVTPELQQVVQTVAALSPAVSAHALQQVLQGIQQQNLAQVKPNSTEHEGAIAEQVKISKKKDKLVDVVCYKCDDPGHYATDCTVVLCIYCDSAKHSSEECKYPKMPKPTAIMYGLCRDDLLFFDVPKTDGLRSRRDSGKNGWIRGQGRFRKINDLKVDDSGCTIFFEDGTGQDLDSWHSKVAWVCVYGFPKELCDGYLALFAVGSLIGKAKKVDMEFTRASEVARMLVQVLNPNLIPNEVEHYFDGEGYMIRFEVEGRAPHQSADLEMEEI
ncbi:hypothetical protein ACQ4PT_065578 [Festuca glaucescens]